MRTIKVYAPLFLVEAYLLYGLWLLFFGPVSWPMENKREFLGFIFLYHAFFIAGYLLYNAYFFRKLTSNTIAKQAPTHKNIFVEHFWIIVFFAFLANIILHRNITLSSSYIPENFFSGVYRGLVTPWQARAYYASEVPMADFIKNPYITASLLIAGPFKYVLLPGLIFYWNALSTARKIVGILVVTIPLFTGIIASLSVINFSYLFITSICLGVLLASNKSRGFFITLKQRKFFLVFLLFIFFFSFWQFYSVKSSHTPYQVAFEKRKPSSFDYLKEKGIHFKSETQDTEKSNIVDLYEKLTVYMVQGYYGMSIALGEEFDTSFGIGHSVFLQKVFADYLGIDVRSRTFQHKITEKWDEFVYWHSFYSYIANDVGFLGVSVIMLILGAYFSAVYLSAIMYDELFSKLLVPLFGILFLYVPANNQVFGFLETMTSFWFLTLLFLLSRNDRANP